MKMSTSMRLLVGIICLIILETAIIVGCLSMYTNSDIERRTENSMHEVLISNARMQDAILEDIVDASERICVDLNMRELISALHSYDAQKTMIWKKSMKKIVFNSFGTLVNDAEDYIRDINIFSEDFSFTDRNLFSYTQQEFIQSDLYDPSLETRPYYRWISTQDVSQQLSARMKTYIQVKNTQVDTVVFRLVKRMTISAVEGDTIYKLSSKIPSPYIVVSVTPKLLYDNFSSEGLTPNTQYMIVDSDGRVISNKDEQLNGQLLGEPDLIEALQGVQGYYSASYVIGGEKAMVGMLSSKSSGWYYVCIIPWSDIDRTARRTVELYMYILAALLGITILIAVFFIRRTMQPVVELAKKADDIASVKDGVLTSDSQRETDRIMTVIDSMNEQIERLTENNLELKDREKDANILMLEMQINPHFMYNSLNRLHLRLLKADQQEIAGQVIALSHALRYSVDAREHLVYLNRDIAQLKTYLTVVQSAHENRFTVYFDIEEKLYDSIVPKMLLQPFVENSVLHGFREMQFGCVIHITGAVQPDGDVVYTITDNGSGIPEERKELLLSGAGGHIGCANVHKRIQLLFGEKYGVTVIPVPIGTQIAVRLPCIFER